MVVDQERFQLMSKMYYTLLEGAGSKKALIRPFMGQFGEFIADVKKQTQWEQLKDMTMEAFLDTFQAVVEADLAMRNKLGGGWSDPLKAIRARIIGGQG